MSLFCWTQRKIFWRMWETEQFWGTIDFHSICFSYYGSQWCPKTAWLQTFFRISSFVFNRTKKFIQVWNYLRVSKWWQNFHFGWIIPWRSMKRQSIKHFKQWHLKFWTKILLQPYSLWMNENEYFAYLCILYYIMYIFSIKENFCCLDLYFHNVVQV